MTKFKQAKPDLLLKVNAGTDIGNVFLQNSQITASGNDTEVLKVKIKVQKTLINISIKSLTNLFENHQIIRESDITKNRRTLLHESRVKQHSHVK